MKIENDIIKVSPKDTQRIFALWPFIHVSSFTPIDTMLRKLIFAGAKESTDFIFTANRDVVVRSINHLAGIYSSNNENLERRIAHEYSLEPELDHIENGYLPSAHQDERVPRISRNMIEAVRKVYGVIRATQVLDLTRTHEPSLHHVSAVELERAVKCVGIGLAQQYRVPGEAHHHITRELIQTAQIEPERDLVAAGEDMIQHIYRIKHEATFNPAAQKIRQLNN